MGKSLSGYLDATAGAEHHPRVIQLIDSLETISAKLDQGVVTDRPYLQQCIML